MHAPGWAATKKNKCSRDKHIMKTKLKTRLSSPVHNLLFAIPCLLLVAVGIEARIQVNSLCHEADVGAEFAERPGAAQAVAIYHHAQQGAGRRHACSPRTARSSSLYFQPPP